MGLAAAPKACAAAWALFGLLACASNLAQDSRSVFRIESLSLEAEADCCCCCCCCCWNCSKAVPGVLVGAAAAAPGVRVAACGGKRKQDGWQ